MARWSNIDRNHRFQAIYFPYSHAKYFRQTSGMAGFGGITSGSWPAANRIIYIPFELDRPMTVTQLAVGNGSGASAGNWDAGIYSADGTKIVSIGSTAQSGVDSQQLFNITDTFLDRGVFYFALVSSSASTTVYRFAGGNANDWLSWGGLQQAATHPLPASATFASNQTAFLPLCGLLGV